MHSWQESQTVIIAWDTLLIFKKWRSKISSPRPSFQLQKGGEWGFYCPHKKRPPIPLGQDRGSSGWFHLFDHKGFFKSFLVFYHRHSGFVKTLLQAARKVRAHTPNCLRDLATPAEARASRRREPLRGKQGTQTWQSF
jgi:hypothetical protein